MKERVSLFIILFISLILTGCTSSKNIEEIIKAIDEIGKVNFASEIDIIKVEEAYNELSVREQKNVTNYDELENARNTYNIIDKFVTIGEEFGLESYTSISEDKKSITVMSNPLNKKNIITQKQSTILKQ